MIKVRHTVSILLAATLVLLSTISSAQLVDISDCRAIEDRLERFDCFESLGTAEAPAAATNNSATTNSATTNSSTSTKPPVFNPGGLPVVKRPANTSVIQTEAKESAPQTADTATTDSEADLFGKKPDASSARIGTNEKGKTELYAKIASLEQRRKNLWLITLEGGQQWLQMESKRYPMQVGDEVKIYPTIWGNSYRMTASRLNGFIQVKRVD